MADEGIEDLLHEMTEQERERLLETPGELYEAATERPAPGKKDPAVRMPRPALSRYKKQAGPGYAPSLGIDDDDESLGES